MRTLRQNAEHGVQLVDAVGVQVVAKAVVQLVGAALLGRYRPPGRPVRRDVPQVDCMRTSSAIQELQEMPSTPWLIEKGERAYANQCLV